MSRQNASSAGLECYAYESMEEPDHISRPAVAAGLESLWITEPDLNPIGPPDSIWEWKGHTDVGSQGMKIPSMLCSEQAPSDSIWEWKGHTDVDPQGMNIPSMLCSEQAPLDSIWNLNAQADLVFSRADICPPLGSSSQGITKSSTMLDTPRKVLRKPKSEEPKPAGNRYLPCNICYKEHGPLCPYWLYIPPGSTVGSGFSVICHICGHLLGMPDWVCYRCGGQRAGKVIKKWCSICDRRYEHESADCPYDKAQAAKYSWVREEEKKKKYSPLGPSGISYVPRKPIR